MDVSRLARLHQLPLLNSDESTRLVSAASIQATRAECIDESSFVLANGRSIASFAHTATAASESEWTQGKKASFVTNARMHAPCVPTLLAELESEVQSVSVSTGASLIAAIDDRARGSILRFQPGHPAASASVVATFRPPQSCERGWTGIANISDTQVASSSSYGSCISLYDYGQAGVTASGNTSSTSSTRPASAVHVATFSCIHRPTALGFVPPSTSVAGHSGLLVSTESSAVCVWDVRARGGGVGGKAALSREMPGNTWQTLYCLDVDQTDGLVAVAGTDATVHVLDPRAGLRALGKWACPAKYDVTGVVLHAAAGLTYVAGADQEVLAGRWAQPRAGSVWARSSGAEGDSVAASASGRAKGQRGAGKARGGGAGEGRLLNDGGFTGKRSAAPGDLRSAMETSDASVTAHGAEPGSGEGGGGGGGLADFRASAAESNDAPAASKGPPGRLALSYHTGFRGDGRWVGFSLLKGEARASSVGDSGGKACHDLLLAVSDGGYAYVVDRAELMAPDS